MDDDCKTPIVTDAPEAIWLQYGELEHDDTHGNLYRDGDVSWCSEKVFGTDVKYVRADIARAAFRTGQEDMRNVASKCAYGYGGGGSPIAHSIGERISQLEIKGE